MKKLAVGLAIGTAILFLTPPLAAAFQKDGCMTKDCRECHALTREEASGLMKRYGLVDKVLNVEMSPVPGLWVADIEKGGRKFPVYIDFSKQYLISGQVMKMSTKEEISGARFITLNAIKANFSEIPLADALMVGSESAKRKAVVFSDPDCHFCGQLHKELKAVVSKDPDVVFYVKLFSVKNNPATIEKATTVICSKSMEFLDNAYDGKRLPAPTCNTQAAEETRKLAERLNIKGTPALVLHDGKVLGGYRSAEELLKLLSDGKK